MAKQRTIYPTYDFSVLKVFKEYCSLTKLYLDFCTNDVGRLQIASMYKRFTEISKVELSAISSYYCFEIYLNSYFTLEAVANNFLKLLNRSDFFYICRLKYFFVVLKKG